MLAEFFNALVAHAKKGVEPTVVVPEREPGHVYYLTKPDGSVEKKEAEAAPRNHTCHSLAALADVVKRCGVAGECCVWYSRAGVVAMLHEETRRDFARLPLTLSPQVNLLARLTKDSPWIDQRTFVRLLRIDLAGCQSACPDLLKTVRNVKWRQNAAGDTELQHGKASVGRSIESQLTGTGTIPENVTLRVPVFNSVSAGLFDVNCAIELDPPNERFQLCPLPDEVEGAIRRAEDAIGEKIADLVGEDVPCFYGSP